MVSINEDLTVRNLDSKNGPTAEQVQMFAKLQAAFGSEAGAGEIGPSGLRLPKNRQISVTMRNCLSSSSTNLEHVPTTRFRGRGPPPSLVGALDSPAPLSREPCWDDPEYSSNSVIPVRVQAHLMELKHIDTVQQEFHAHAWIQLKWREFLPEGTDPNGPYQAAALSAMGLGKWKPSLTFLGIARDCHCDDKLRVSHEKGDHFATMFLRYTISGTFSQKMFLRAFPFDHQCLQIRSILWGVPSHIDGISLSAAIDGKPGPCRTLKLEMGKHQIYEEGFVQSDAWELLPDLFVTQGATRPLHEDKVQFTTLNFSCYVQRRQSFYFVNFVGPLFMLAAINFVSFFLLPTQLADKMNLTLAILLTTVAFRFSMVSYIPVTSYMTMLDMYMVTSFWMSFLVSIQALVVYMLETSESTAETELSTRFNIWCGTSLGSFWVLLHLSLPFISYVQGILSKRWAENIATEDPNEKQLEASPL